MGANLTFFTLTLVSVNLHAIVKSKMLAPHSHELSSLFYLRILSTLENLGIQIAGR